MFGLRTNLLVLVALIASFVLGSPARAANGRTVVELKISGSIGVGVGTHVDEGIAYAKANNAELLVIRLDTPGGLVSATREIIQIILAAPVPIAVYIAPSGARAASAGTFITYAAHVAAMAPGTHIGAATPVALNLPGLSPPGQRDDKEQAGKTASERKMLNDSIAYLRSLAQLRGRNPEWADRFVRDAKTLTADEALKEGVIDVLATDFDMLMAKLEGRTIKLAGRDVTLSLAGAQRVELESSWRVKFLSAITDPNLVFILLMIGVYGIIFEFWTPGLTGPGIVGAICLIVALMGLSALPVSYAGLALLLLGVALMVGEAMAPGIGILGIGGVIAFVTGALFLFDPSGSDIDFSIFWPVVLAVALTSLLLLAGLLGFVLSASRQPIRTGNEELIGAKGKVVSWRSGQGQVRVHGEIWQAQASTDFAAGTHVRIKERDGLTLIVERREEEAV